MNLEGLEPRRVLWALGEVWWVDRTGVPWRIPATIEDTSPSGACVRVKTAIDIGSSLTVKWHREQFSGVARNRRRDGSEFLVGIQRSKGKGIQKGESENAGGNRNGDLLPSLITPKFASPVGASIETGPTASPSHSSPLASCPAPSSSAPTSSQQTSSAALPLLSQPVPDLPGIPSKNANHASVEQADATPPERDNPKPSEHEAVPKVLKPAPSAITSSNETPQTPAPPRTSSALALLADGETGSPRPVHRPAPETEPSSVRQERNLMDSNPLFRKFWRHQPDSPKQPETVTPAEVPVSKSEINKTESGVSAQSELLSCEDIYHASGIFEVGSRYDIAKIVEMLNSKHIRELPKEVKRASVLMALDAAGTSVDEVLTDAARRQHALNAYETGRQKFFEQFEADKTRENAQIKVEIERVTARYAERIQQNLDQIAREKEAFRQWQSTKEGEMQKIGEAIALCGKQTSSEPAANAQPTPDPEAALAKGVAAAESGSPTSSAPAVLKPPPVPIR